MRESGNARPWATVGIKMNLWDYVTKLSILYGETLNKAARGFAAVRAVRVGFGADEDVEVARRLSERVPGCQWNLWRLRSRRRPGESRPSLTEQARWGLVLGNGGKFKWNYFFEEMDELCKLRGFQMQCWSYASLGIICEVVIGSNWRAHGFARNDLEN
ncbi:hypothetical protein BDQ12DRAFT_683073 [Crucibulum laeve]|uniref:Uncharacterized protein n=1 Tax=Crucibulum laeve TaxID=68775 RepID=A0A5C3M078_9AGAR|nr:hypothetical protein BDQ12DRAFT_683073 [Crucibulum laeve]